MKQFILFSTLIMCLFFTACQEDEVADVYQLSQTAWQGNLLTAVVDSDGALYYKVDDISMTFSDRKSGEFFMSGFSDKVVFFQYAADAKMMRIESDRDFPLTGNWWISDINAKVIRLKRSTTNSAQMDMIELSRKHF